MSHNRLGGTIPQWLGNLGGSLEVLNLQRNNFSGNIPEQIFAYGRMKNMMKVLELSHNQLQGKVPQSLINCGKLQALNLGHNQLSDTFPFWLQTLLELQVLVLRSNKFFVPIWHPQTFFGFVKLGIIDLSFNDFNGNLPSEYFRNWGGMMKDLDGNKLDIICSAALKEKSNYSMTYKYAMSMINKEIEMEFTDTLVIFMSIDLSNNRFGGEIPSRIGDLRSLIMLNLSSNNFTGNIPLSLGYLNQLESLDISK
nr:receptor-like protein 18 [Ziziphus jujuba var. spinosa]